MTSPQFSHRGLRSQSKKEISASKERKMPVVHSIKLELSKNFTIQKTQRTEESDLERALAKEEDRKKQRAEEQKKEKLHTAKMKGLSNVVKTRQKAAFEVLRMNFR